MSTETNDEELGTVIDRGNYRYATVMKQTMDDPRNDIEAGRIEIVAGRAEDGIMRTVPDDESKGFIDIEGEVIERFHADRRMSERDIKTWGARQAKESEVDYSNA